MTERFHLKFKGKYTIERVILVSYVDGTGKGGQGPTQGFLSSIMLRSMWTVDAMFLRTWLCCAANVTMISTRGGHNCHGG